MLLLVYSCYPMVSSILISGVVRETSYRRMDCITGKFISEFRWDVFVGRERGVGGGRLLLSFCFSCFFFFFLKKISLSYFNRFLSELKTSDGRGG